MKRPGLIFLFAAALSPLCHAAPAIGLLPEDKMPLQVAESERNPFGKRVVKVAAVQAETESEESKIRAVIEKLPLGGMTRGYGVVKVLLGSYMVAEGQTLPDVIPNQTEKVKVLSVTADRVELGFVDKDGTAETRKIGRLFNLSPSVRFKLGGKPAPEAKGDDAAGLDGVTKKNEPGTSR